MSYKRIGEFLLGLDMYGHAIGVHYRGRDAFKTKLGTVVTLATYVLMTVNMVSLLTAFKDGSMQEEKSQRVKFDAWSHEAVNIAD